MDITKEKCDLHLHTFYSDGTLSPTAIVERAASLGQKIIAVTDHDGTDGVQEAICAAEKYGINVIPGIEISTVYDETVKLHMLGYCIDIHDEQMQEVMERLKKVRAERNVRLLKALSEIGYEIEEDDIPVGEGGTFIGKPQYAIAMARKGYIAEPDDAFGKDGVFRRPEIIAVSKLFEPGTYEAIELIHGAGGKAVIAHPGKIRGFRYGPEDKAAERCGAADEGGRIPCGTEAFYEAAEKLIIDLKKHGLDGIECLHTDHTEEDCRLFKVLAEKHKLMATCGSDYHGPEFERGTPD